MPTSSQIDEVPKDDGSTAERLHMEFTNGSLQQLRDLAAFFGVTGDPSEVVKLAISFLQNLKDRQSRPDQVTPPRKTKINGNLDNTAE